MAEIVSRALVSAFYEAYASHDTDKLVPMLDDEVTWTIRGPVDVLGYCGRHSGKPAVINLVDRLVPSVYRVVSFVQDSVVIDGDRVATLNRLSGRQSVGGRVMSYRLAHFLRFCSGKLIEAVSLIDSFDAAEQMLGHPLDVHSTVTAQSGDLVAV